MKCTEEYGEIVVKVITSQKESDPYNFVKKCVRVS